MRDRSRPSILVLAPHLVYPVRNGADIAVAELARALSQNGCPVRVVSSRAVVHYGGGEEEARHPFENAMRSRSASAIRTALFRSHYYAEKFLTPGFLAEARCQLASPDVDVVLHSYLTTASGADLPDSDRPHLVLTHNDEFAWFEDLRASVRNLVGQAAASASLQWLRQFMAAHGDHVTLLHFTEADRAGWEREVPGHRAAVVPIGVSLRGAPAPPLAPEAAVRLLFVGTLGVRMNRDALVHFASRYLPALRDRLGTALSVTVAGSSPSPEIEALCEREGWALRPDVSEDEMDALFRSATFSLLPFAYATGAKLKLLKSLAYGVPALCTEAVSAQASLVVPPSLVSDAPSEWADRVATVRHEGISLADRARLLDVARAHSWDASAEAVLDVASSQL